MRRRLKLLSTTRPPLHRITKSVSSSTPSISSKKGRTLIRTIHTLRKRHASALSSQDHEQASELEEQIQALGGLEAYQVASLNGQKGERGGDSSSVLVGWLNEGKSGQKRKPQGQEGDAPRKIRVLEVGALSPKNAISKFPGVEMTRIDLHSQSPLIEEQDFMQRPLAKNEEGKFDVLSLSLVLNFVSDAAGKGEMLRRTCQFLVLPDGQEETSSKKARKSEELDSDEKEQDEHIYPCLFLVLPAPCIYNSRYMHEYHLTKIMESLGYRCTRRKVSSKLAYYLWRWNGWESGQKKEFAKKEINPGAGRNNFCVVLK